MSETRDGIQLEIFEKNGIIKFTLKGRLDGLNADHTLETMFNHIANKANVKVVIDLSFLDYISSAGLRVLIIFGKHINKVDGAMSGFFKDNEKIHKLFIISGLDNIFKFTADEADAYETLEG